MPDPELVAGLTGIWQPIILGGLISVSKAMLWLLAGSSRNQFQRSVTSVNSNEILWLLDA